MRRKRNINQLILIAQDYLQKSQYNNAIKVLNQVAELEPKNDQAYRLLGDAFDQLLEKQQAQKNYKLCLDCNPLSVIGYTNYGLLLYSQGRKQEAEKMYQLCMEINPDDATVLNNYSILLYEMRKFEKAGEIAKRCLQIDPENQRCKENMRKINQLKVRGKKKQKEVQKKGKKQQLVSAFHSQEKFLQLLWQRDLKIAQKQSTIQILRKQLEEKQNDITQLSQELKKYKQKRSYHQSQKLCKICLCKMANFINTKCGHISTCGECIPILGKKCPICRGNGSFIKVYSSFIREQLLQ